MKYSRRRSLIGWPGLCFLGSVLLASLALALGTGVIVNNFGSEMIFGYTTSGVYDLTDTYMTAGKSCTATLDPVNVTEVMGTSGNYFDVLEAAFPTADGWVYQSSASPLSAGTLEVRTYDVQGTSTRVGAELHVKYTPGVGDPTANMHWIQVVTDNHNVTDNPGHGNPENVVDNPFSPSGRAPYYDDGGAADSGNCTGGCDFYDFPGRVDAANDHTWTAVSFLVDGPDAGAGAGTITFHGPGFEWGWENSCVDKPRSGYWSTPSGPVQGQSTTPIVPGALVTVTPVFPASMLLTKGEITAEVFIESATVTAMIDEAIDEGGISSFVINSGSGQFQPYLFGDSAVGASKFVLLGGNGAIHWGTGEISADVTLLVSAGGFASILANANGTGVIDFGTDTITLDPDSIALEVAAGVPAMGIWGAALLSLALFGLGSLLMWRRMREVEMEEFLEEASSPPDSAETGHRLDTDRR